MTLLLIMMAQVFVISYDPSRILMIPMVRYVSIEEKNFPMRIRES